MGKGLGNEETGFAQKPPRKGNLLCKLPHFGGVFCAVWGGLC